MLNLPLPQHDPGNVYDLCISRVRDRTLQRRLASVRQSVVDAADLYALAATQADLYTVVPQPVIGTVSGDEMVDVYTLRMARKDAPGRLVYDQLMGAPPHGICPFCGQRQVSTLDHYLPKASFPVFAVVPANLVPACKDCNGTKLEAIAHTQEDQSIHPYFDVVGDAPWLAARIVEQSPPAVLFSVTPPAGWSQCMAARVANHFRTFKLAALYTAHAAVELENIRHFTANLLEAVGPAAVQAHLLLQAESRAKVHRNSWQTALYYALAENDWYCTGGAFQNKC